MVKIKPYNPYADASTNDIIHKIDKSGPTQPDNKRLTGYFANNSILHIIKAQTNL